MENLIKKYLVFGVLLLVISSIGCTSTTSQETTSTPEITMAQELFENKCSGCHSLDEPASKRFSYDEWRATVQRMINNGAPLNDEEAKLITDYLAETYGPE